MSNGLWLLIISLLGVATGVMFIFRGEHKFRAVGDEAQRTGSETGNVEIVLGFGTAISSLTFLVLAVIMLT